MLLRMRQWRSIAERVLADEQAFVALEAEHHVARADAGHPEVGVNAHDRRVPEGARLGVPARVKRRIEMEAMTGDLDAGDDGSWSMERRKEGFGHASISFPYASDFCATARRRSGDC